MVVPSMRLRRCVRVVAIVMVVVAWVGRVAAGGLALVVWVSVRRLVGEGCRV